MTLPQPRPTPSEGVYAAISVGDIVNIPSSIKKTLIHRGISLNSLPLASFLKIASAHEKYWWFSAANSIIYPSNVVLTQKSIARVTGQSSSMKCCNIFGVPSTDPLDSFLELWSFLEPLYPVEKFFQET
jgi:hypothetical protein